MTRAQRERRLDKPSQINKNKCQVSNRVLTTGARDRWWANWRTWGGIAGLAVAVLVATTLNAATLKMAVFWGFGLSFGFILQRSRFCFASAFRDLFILRDGRVMKGILAGLAVATGGFALVMYGLVPKNLGLGIIPFNSYVLPLGPYLLLAGVLFGLGMVVAGSCISGTLYRIGEGYITAMVTLGSILVGMGLLLHNWNWWWQSHISLQPYVWLPHSLGWAGAISLTLAVLVITYLLIRRWESYGMVIAKPVHVEPTATSIQHKLSALRRAVLVKAWPIILAGAILGLLNTFEYLFERPWGVTGDISRWSTGLFNLIQLPPPEITSMPGPCGVLTSAPSLLTWGLMINSGIVFGSFIAALLAGEFKIRLPRQKRRYLQASVGGLLMGYGAGLASGCTIGGFFSAVPSLGLNGLVFGGALALGAFLGVQVIKRIG